MKQLEVYGDQVMAKLECFIRIVEDFGEDYRVSEVDIEDLKHDLVDAILFKPRDEVRLLMELIAAIKNMECRVIEK